MTADHELCGLFGKVPQQADFVTHHLPGDFIDHWHLWLQSSMRVAQEQLGDDWLETYLTSPVWRFVLSPGVCGDAGAVGVMIPSVDEVGRYFPLVIAHCGDYRPWSVYRAPQDWHDQAAQVALSALGEKVSYMDLVVALETLALPEYPDTRRFQTQSALGARSTAWQIGLEAADSTEDTIQALLEQAHRRWVGELSLWWTEGSEQVAPSLLVVSGMPDAGQLAAMFDGDWRQWGWAMETPVEADAEEAPC